MTTIAAEQFMQRALDLARRGEGRTRPNPPVGALVVKGNEVVGEGFHPRAGEPHAEIFALRQAGEGARGADLFVTLEPCSHRGRTGPCTEAILAAGIRRVYVGTTDPNPLVNGAGIRQLRAAGLEVETGLLGAESARLIAPFAKHVTSGLPFLILKAALTLDGFTATSAGDSQWISCEESRLEVHRLRDRVDGILVGSGTVLADDPRLTTRLPEGGRDPARIVVDSRLRIPEDAALLHLESPAPTLLATTGQADPDRLRRLRDLGHEVLVLPALDGRVDLGALLAELGRRGLQSLLVEGGGTLNGELWRRSLIDRVMLFLAPLVLGGGDGRGLFSGPGPLRLSDAVRLEGLRVRRCGEDFLLEGEVRPCSPG